MALVRTFIQQKYYIQNAQVRKTPLEIHLIYLTNKDFY